MSSLGIKNFLRVAEKLPASTSVMLRGPHGIGKSQIIRQLSEVIKKSLGLATYEVIDRRLSQVTEGDIIGLPSTDGEVTRFNPPDWYKRACSTACVLFLDELNRATAEVMQAAFQIVLDRELNGWKLHPETRVYTAINASANYNVNEIDPALLDRFWVVDLEPTTEDWLDWARRSREDGGGDLHPNVVDFIASNEKFLDPPKTYDPGIVHPSRRSWERVNRAITSAGIADDPQNTIFYQMVMGYVGPEATIAFTDFCKSIDNRISGEEIINSWSKVKKKIERLGQERLVIAIDKVAEYAHKELDKFSDKQGKNLSAFMDILPGELKITLWAKIAQAGNEKIELMKSAHKHLVKQVLDVFGVPLGPAGVGVMPQIPSMFQNQDKK